MPRSLQLCQDTLFGERDLLVWRPRGLLLGTLRHQQEQHRAEKATQLLKGWGAHPADTDNAVDRCAGQLCSTNSKKRGRRISEVAERWCSKLTTQSGSYFEKLEATVLCRRRTCVPWCNAVCAKPGLEGEVLPPLCCFVRFALPRIDTVMLTHTDACCAAVLAVCPSFSPSDRGLRSGLRL